MENITLCPICKSQEFVPFITCKDHTTSGENFNIIACKHCGFKLTSPRPKINEIAKYYKSESYISHTSTRKGFINGLYQIARKYTLGKKIRLLDRLSVKGKMLDIGCGTGHFLQACCRQGWDGMGIEPDPDARKMAETLTGRPVWPENKLDELPENSFRIITLWHVLEHVHELNQRITQLKKLLHPEGKLIIAVPNHTAYDAAFYRQFWGAYDVPRHLYHFSPTDINRLFTGHGFELQEILPMKLDAYYVSLLSEKYRRGDLYEGIYRGFLSNLKARRSKKNTWSSQIYILSKKQGI